MEKILEKLFALQDEEYGGFMARLLPTVRRETIIGVRMPYLRRIAKEMLKSGEFKDFLESLPHVYYEENALHALIISEMRDGDEALLRIDAFLPYVDNWGICDSLRPRSLSEGDERLLGRIDTWIKSSHVYTQRFAIEMLMLRFLDEGFMPQYLDTVAAISTNEYYLNMMIGWYFATALTKRWDSVISFLEGDAISPIARKMAIKKGIESLAITNDKKAYLRELSQKQT
jgi:3-methyladenine DNA glycosylase AlkD